MKKHRKVQKFFNTNRERTWKWWKIIYGIIYTDSLRFMSRLLSYVANNLAEELGNNKYKYCKSFLELKKVKDKLSISKYFKCSKKHKKYLNKDLVKRFANRYKFCDGDINIFCLIIRKGVILVSTWIVGRGLTRQNY